MISFGTTPHTHSVCRGTNCCRYVDDTINGPVDRTLPVERMEHTHYGRRFVDMPQTLTFPFSSSQRLLHSLLEVRCFLKPISECRCDERLQTKVDQSTRLVYTGFLGELEHLNIRKAAA